MGGLRLHQFVTRVPMKYNSKTHYEREADTVKTQFHGMLDASRNVLAAAVLVLPGSLVFAQDDGDNEYFEEVIVTAERTAKSVMDLSLIHI